MSEDITSSAVVETSPRNSGAGPFPCPTRLPELLAPAGDWECAKAAVENGADAIYFGLERFNARMRAANFTAADLPKLMAFLHQRGVKGYVTLNTLVFQDELAEAEQCLRTVIAAGVDAVIVQDVGICRLIREISPDFPIHASTQMTITSAQGIQFAKELGCHLVVLARECSLKEIASIQKAQQTSRSEPGSATTSAQALPLEVFVHGALCVAYSGQCLTSEALGGRSANRGECAQACRMPYELISDGQKVPLGDRRYLLSPQDLAGLPVLPDLVKLGMASLKIEGRLKSAEYVANITRIYRSALEALRVPPVTTRKETAFASNEPAKGAAESVTSQYEMEMAFSRGLSTGWFRGIDNQRLVHARFGKKRGVYLGQVKRVLRDRVAVELQAPLKAGDGVVIDAGKPEKPEEGGRIYGVSQNGPEAWLAFGQDDVDFQRIRVGDKLWKTNDPELDRRLRASYSTEKPQFLRPIEIDVHGHVDGPLFVTAHDEGGHVVRVQSSMPLTLAKAQPLTTERLREFLGRLGGTGFHLGNLRNHLEGETILPFSELNRLRRECVCELERLRVQPPLWALRPHNLGNAAGAPLSLATAKASQMSPGQPELIVLVRNLEQLEAALDCAVRTIYLEFEDPKKYRLAVDRFRAWQTLQPAERVSSIYVAPPRIFKMGEDWVLKQVRSCEPDGFLIRNYDHLAEFSDRRCIGDYSFNIANAIAATYFKERFGLERITASYDLNNQQLEALLSAAPPAWFEITIHQHMPMFHMEHCVFCAFLSQGTDYTNCGRPCDVHNVQLQDRVGARHPLKADAGCRNTVFNSMAQTGAEHVGKLQQLGVRHFRVEFLTETADLVSKTIRQYQSLLSGQTTGTKLWRDLRLLNQLGVTRGQAEKPELSSRTRPH